MIYRIVTGFDEKGNNTFLTFRTNGHRCGLKCEQLVIRSCSYFQDYLFTDAQGNKMRCKSCMQKFGHPGTSYRKRGVKK